MRKSGPPPPGQRSISSFFGARPTPVAAVDVAVETTKRCPDANAPAIDDITDHALEQSDGGSDAVEPPMREEAFRCSRSTRDASEEFECVASQSPPLPLSSSRSSPFPPLNSPTQANDIDVPLKPASAMEIDAAAPVKGGSGAEGAATASVSADAATRPRSSAARPPAAAVAPPPRLPKEERAVRPAPDKAKKEEPAEEAAEEESEDEPVAVGKRPRRAAAAAARKRAVVRDDSDDDDGDDDDEEASADESGSESDFSAAAQEETEDEDDDEDEESESEEEESDEEPSPPKKKSRPAPAVAKASAAAAPAPPPRASFAAAKSTPFTAKTSAAFAQTPATPATAAAGAEAEANASSDAVARYSARDAERFPFLQPGALRDASGLEPGDLNYDPRSLRIPPGWFKAMKITEAQRQWWELKARNFDSVLLFKMGKFYEMFEMDAHVGADILGLQYMKGEQPHCGFPEASYAPYAEKLARAGLRVVVVEQTETPAALAARNEERKRKGLQKVNVVNRDVISVLTIGTLTDPEMLTSSPDAANVVALVEFAPPKSLSEDDGGNAADENRGDESESADTAAATILGAACFDAATGRVSVGGWADSASRPRLRALLAELRPVEIVVPRGSGGAVSCPPASRVSPLPATTLAPVTRRVILGGGLSLRVNELDAPSDGGAALDAVDASYSCSSASSSSRPALIERLASSLKAGDDLSPAAASAALAALAAASAFLRDCKLDAAVLGLRRLERLPCADAPSARDAEEVSALSENESDPSSSPASQRLSPFHESLPPLAIDGAALDALEVLANGSGGVAGTLLSALDFCVSPPGRRRLRAWLCRPLGCPRAISKRQDAVESLLNSARNAADSARASLAGCGDLERSLARLSAAAAAAAAATGVGRDAAGVVLYEDAAKRRVLALVGALKGLRLALDALSEIRSLPDSDDSQQKNGVLRALSTSPLLSSADAALRELENAADWRAAAEAGRVCPAHRGADAAVDAADDALAAADAALASHLDDERSALRCRSAALVPLGKETHVLEVPDATKVPNDYSLVAQRKGFRRYVSPKLRELVTEREAACAQRETALAGVLRGLLARFGARCAAWTAVADAAATLDALLSLAAAAEAGGAFGPMCRPVVLSPVKKEGDADGEGQGEKRDFSPAPSLSAVALRHPAAEALLLSSSVSNGGDSSFSSSSTFVPNDVALGGSSGSSRTPPFVLLTGPNMGGKSTLLRQVCLAALAAHAGAWVPASSFELTAVDAIFVRAGGARDAMLAGASTFLVELQEAAAPLQRGTVNSLVALDELGRGTATADGAAIAGAVLDSLALKTKCRGLFATHYHSLSAEKEGSIPSSSSSPSSPSSGLAVARGGALPMHMSCRVDDEDDSNPASIPRVTFLYRLVRGACPKSYGTNVARLAGLPDPVVKRAAALAAELEEEGKSGSGGADDAAPSTPVPADLADLVRRAAAAAGGKGDLREAVQAARAALEGMV